MKIACIGNINNCMFPLTRYLADAGHKVTLFLLEEFQHFLPSADVFDSVDNVEIVELGWHHQNFYAVSANEIKKKFKPFDFFIGTDYSPAYFLKARMTLDIFFPAGGDLFDYPYRKMGNYKGLPEIFRIESWRCTKYQKWALPLVGCVSMDPANEFFERFLPKLKMEKIDRIPALPFLYMKQYSEEYFLKSKFSDQINKIKKENDFVIIQHCRQSWTCDKANLHYKANDLLIEGFKLLVENNPEKKCKLLLLEYGEDVEQTKKLIDDLGISQYVIWFPKSLRKDLLGIIKFCDVGVGELGRSWFSYGAVYEILAMKVAFIGNRNDAEFLSRSPELYPMLNATTKEEVFEGLDNILKDQEKYKELGQKSYNWFLKYAINKSVDTILKRVSEKNLNKKENKIGSFLYLKLLIIDSFVKIIVLLNIIKLKFLQLFSLSASGRTNAF
ncbi:MAG: hypothetical protein H0W73_00130 [Bacteroidetes bacterium]|nr:hypothetical protein [Bacteroidota bacterium]